MRLLHLLYLILADMAKRSFYNIGDSGGSAYLQTNRIIQT
jgi:hypothetical protein